MLTIDTTWSTDIIESNVGYVALPTNVKSGVFIQAASDIADYGQENSSQHVTNTVLYQYGEMNIQHIGNKTQQKSIQRSLSIPVLCLGV